MFWDCKFDNKAIKDLQKIVPLQQKRILKAIKVLTEDPYLKNNKIKRLAGSLSSYYRLRIGNYRVLYIISQDERTIFIKAVLPRNEKTYK